MSEKKSVTVNIYGNEYTLKGEADPQYIADLAKFVDTKMAEIGKKSSAPAAKVAILASMNIADELHRLEKAKAENLKLIENLEKNLLEMKKSSDGSLKHTMELKEQIDKFKTEATENGKKAEEANAEAQKEKKELETATKKSEELTKEIDRLKGELQEIKPRLENLKESIKTEKKSNEEAKAEIETLKAQVEENAKNPKAGPQTSGPAPTHALSPTFLPTEEKLHALFKKIDAILE
jgi:cell division protein ZapA